MRIAVGPEPLEDVVLARRPARRQCAALRTDALDLPAQRDLLGEQRIARRAVVGAFVWKLQMFHASPCKNFEFASECDVVLLQHQHRHLHHYPPKPWRLF